MDPTQEVLITANILLSQTDRTPKQTMFLWQKWTKIVLYPRYVATSSWSQVSGTRDARDQEIEPFIDVSVGGQDLREGELQVGVRAPQC